MKNLKITKIVNNVSKTMSLKEIKEMLFKYIELFEYTDNCENCYLVESIEKSSESAIRELFENGLKKILSETKSLITDIDSDLYLEYKDLINEIILLFEQANEENYIEDLDYLLEMILYLFEIFLFDDDEDYEDDEDEDEVYNKRLFETVLYLSTFDKKTRIDFLYDVLYKLNDLDKNGI